VQDPAGDGISLLRKKLQRSRLQIQKQRPLQDEKELVLGLMLVPMELPFKDAQADDAIVDLGQIEVDPFLGVLADHAGDVDDLGLAEFRIHSHAPYELRQTFFYPTLMIKYFCRIRI